MIRSWIAAAVAAACSSSSVASGRAYSRFVRTESWNRYVSWVTTPTSSPTDASLIRRMSWPSISTAPESTSYSRGIR